MSTLSIPNAQNNYQSTYLQLLLRNLYNLVHIELIDNTWSLEAQAKNIFNASYYVLAHNALPDPVFCYANKAALDLFEMTWDELTALPSRLSAEPGLQSDRERFLQEVEAKGFSSNYSGIRISKSGRRFWIKDVLLWNIYDQEGLRIGQAALFERIEYV